jgi:hypothetical protein
VRSEDASLGGHALRAQELGEFLDEWGGDFGTCCVGEGGTPSLARVAVEREL